MGSNFSRSLIGGDIGGLASLAATLKSYPPQIRNVVDALDHHVEGLVQDAGWWGDAADAFKRQWEVDATGAQALADLVTALSGVIGSLAINLRKVEGALEQSVSDARAAGVPVGPDGNPPVLPTGASPAVQAAATTYEQEWRVAQDMALQTRMDANQWLMGFEARIGPEAVGYGAQLRPDQWATDADYLRGFWAIPASAREYLHDKTIPTLRAERVAAHTKFTQAVKWYSKRNLKTPDDIKGANRKAIAQFQDAKAEMAKLDELTAKMPMAKLLDTRVGSLVKLAPGLDSLAADSKLLKVLADVPVVDIAAVVVGTGLQSYDDMQKGEDWTAVPKELTANVGGMVVGAAVGAAVVVVGVALIGASAPVLLVVGVVAVGAAVGGVVAVGVGDAISNAWHEHWDEDIHKYGELGGIGHGLADVGTKTAHDMGDLATKTGGAIVNAGSSLWHGIFG